MTVYRFNKHSHLVRRRVFKLGLISIGLVLLIIGAAYFILSRSDDAEPSEVVQAEVDYNPLKEFVTNYFRFSATDAWRQADDLGNSINTFVYRKYLKDTPVGILTVQINATKRSLNTHVVPLTVKDGRITAIGEPSSHCGESLPKGVNRDPRNVTVDDVTFLCWTDGTSYIVSAGSRGGSLQLPLKRINGTVSLYSITYQNTAFEEDELAILEILRTFEAR